MYTYKEKLNYELNRLRDDRDAQNQFFGGALQIQNSPKTYDKNYADDKMNFACDVLCRLDWCGNERCSRCKLFTANRNAHAEIDAGLRKRPHQDSQKVMTVPGYWINASVDKKTGALNITMRPFIEKEETK